MKRTKATEKKKPKEAYVKPPEGFEVPEIEVGESFELVMEVTKKKDGLCITAWDGIPVDEKKERREEEEEQESIGAGARRAAEGGY